MPGWFLLCFLSNIAIAKGKLHKKFKETNGNSGRMMMKEWFIVTGWLMMNCSETQVGSTGF